MNHIGTQTITTPRLILRRFVVDDAAAMFRNWASDPRVTKFLTWPVHESEDVTRQLLTAWVNQYSDPRWYQWAIVPRELDEPIGSISAVRLHDQTASVDIGYCIGSRWWGQGITAEALRAVIGYFFEQVGMNAVCACHDTNNPNSGKVMLKSGMTYEGTRRQSDVNNQGICDASWYSILRNEYFAEKTSTCPLQSEKTVV
jgi:ribosomal-protein-alanine N-acetyltransferase